MKTFAPSRKRVVMFVMNAVSHDRRVLREADSLSNAGYSVTIVGTQTPGSVLPAREARPSGVEILRVPMAAKSPLWRPTRATLARFAKTVRRSLHPRRLPALLPRLPWLAAKGAFSALYVGLNLLSFGQMDWLIKSRYRWWRWARLAIELAGPADIYHGHDLNAIGAAGQARGRYGGILIYDSHEVFVEAGATGARPAWTKALLGYFERHWYSRADALIAVNPLVAAELHRRYGPKHTAVLYNCVPRWDPPQPRPNLLRSALGLSDDVPVLLYHGGFNIVRGLLPLAEGMLRPELATAHLVLLGYGPLEDKLRDMAADPRFGGRLHVLDAVSPDELDLWVASADVGLMPNQPASLNELVSTPNKLFENIAAGVPVVTSDFPARRAIVLEDPVGPLGAVCDPTDPASIAAAIASLLGNSASDRAALRDRCLRAAAERWNWQNEERKLLALYAELLPGSQAVSAGDGDLAERSAAA